MSAVGWAVLPLTVSLRGLHQELNKELMEPARQAAKKAGSDIQSGLGDAAERAAKDVARARQTEEKAAQDVTKAEEDLARTRSKAEQDARKIESQEAKLTAAREKGARDVAKAERDLADARDSGDVQRVADAESKLAEVRAATDSRVIDREVALDRARDAAAASASKVETAEEGVARAKDQAANASENVIAASKRYDSAMDGSTANTLDMSGELKELQGELQETSDGFTDTANEASTFGDRIRSGLSEIGRGALLGIGARIGTSVLSGVSGAMSGGWQAALDIDTGTRVLEGMYDSAESAHDMMADLRDLAANSPIDHSSYLDAAQALAYTGVQGESAISILENVGLAALASGKDGDQAYQSMNDALARMVNEGRVGLQSLQQLSGAGVPILSGLAEHFGVSMEEVNKMATEGVIDFEDVLSVMENATGDYFQTALQAGEDASASLENQLKQAQDNIVTAVGGALAPVLREMDFEEIGSTVAELAVELTGLIEPMLDIGKWFIDNRDWLIPLAGTFAGIAAAVKLWTAAQTISTTVMSAWATVTGFASTIATGASIAFRAMWAALTGPIGLVVSGIALVSAGLTWFFTQTETGQAIWEGFTSAISTGWEWVTGAFSAAWGMIQPILAGIWNMLSTVGQIVIAVFAMPFVLAWQMISAAASWAWEHVLAPTWEHMQGGLSHLGMFFGWVWEALIRPMWEALGAGIQWVWTSVIQPAWGAMQAGLDVLGGWFDRIWNAVIKPVWDALGAGIRAVYDAVIQPAFNALQSGLERVGSFFSTITDGIRRTWDGMREHVARPINFVIETVWNNGLVAAWNKIAEFLPGLPPAATLSPIRFAEGGEVPLWAGQRGKDSVLALMMPDEHVLDVEDVDRLGGQQNVYRMRAMLDAGMPFDWNPTTGVKPSGHGDPSMHLPHFRDGGALDDSPAAGIRLSPTPGEHNLEDIAKLAKRLIHRIWPEITTIYGWRQDAFPEHPSGRALDVMVGTGALQHLGDEVNDWAHANHGVLPLTHSIWRQRMWYPESGPAANLMGDRGDPTQNHMDHPHIWYRQHAIDPNVIPPGLVGHDGLSNEERRGIIRELVREILDKAMDPIIGGMKLAIGTPPPEWLGIPPEVATTTKDAAIETAFDFVDNITGSLRDIYSAARELGGTFTGLFRDEGGFIPPGNSIVTNETGRPEAVLNWEQLQQILALMESAQGLAAMEAWALGDPRMAIRQGVDESTVEAVDAIGWQFADHMGEVLASAGESMLSSYESELFDFFGIGGLVGDLRDIHEAFHPSASGTGTATGGVPSQTSGARSTGAVVTHGDPSLQYEVFETDIETQIPNLAPEGWLRYPHAITEQAHLMDLPRRAAVIGNAVALVEVGDPMKMYANHAVPASLNFPHDAIGSDHDSVGLFQQRDNGAWGTVEQRMDPHQSAKMFYDAMLQKFPNWEQMDMGAVAQGVQVSAFPDRYATRMERAAELVDQTGFYDSGGILPPGLTLALNKTRRDELILNPEQWESVADMARSALGLTEWVNGGVSALEAYANAPVMPGPARGDMATHGGDVAEGPLVQIGTVYTRDDAEMAREVAREAARVSRSASRVGGRRR